MATKAIVNKEKNVNLTKRFDNVKKTVNEINDFVLEASEEVVEGMVERTNQWQDVASKAIKGSLKLAANQQNMMFETLDTLKGQVQTSRNRFKKLFSKN